MLTVYRLENEYGNGPYRGAGTSWETSCHSKRRNTPPPNEEFGAWEVKGEYLFGFRSLTQLYKWFNKTEVKRLLKLGFKVKSFKAKVVLFESKKQLIYIPLDKKGSTIAPE